MSYNDQIGPGGYASWKILERTMLRQRGALSQDHVIRSSKEYFSQRFPLVETADQFVNDYRILTVALRAFGLDSDISNKYFLKKVLEADPNDSGSFINRLSDKRYLRMNQALSFYAPLDERGGVIDISSIIEKYEIRSLEKNIGGRYPEIELALNARRELSDLAASDASENVKWYQVLSSKPLRRVFEVAYGLGEGFSALSIDRQLYELKGRTGILTGSNDVSQFKSDEVLDIILKRFLLRSQINVSPVGSRYTNALVLLGLRRV